MKELYAFMVLMWAMIIIGGGIAVVILGPISITGYGELDPTLTSVFKGGVAVLMVILWIYILSKIKGLIFKKIFLE